MGLTWNVDPLGESILSFDSGYVPVESRETGAPYVLGFGDYSRFQGDLRTLSNFVYNVPKDGQLLDLFVSVTCNCIEKFTFQVVISIDGASLHNIILTDLMVTIETGSRGSQFKTGSGYNRGLLQVQAGDKIGVIVKGEPDFMERVGFANFWAGLTYRPSVDF